MNNYSKQTSEQDIAQMKHLMNFGINEDVKKKNNDSIIEFHAVGADGNTYGILREGTKYYIKVAPKKDSKREFLSEDYNYIGGFMNKNQYEYDSYASASKNFEFKMRSLNEAFGTEKNDNSQINESADWTTEKTKGMRSELERMNELSENIDTILESKGNFTTEHTLPEAPAVSKDPKSKRDPYTEDCTGDKLNFDKQNYNPKKSSNPYKNPKTASTPYKEYDGSHKGAENGTKPTGSENNGNPFTEKPKFAPKNSVATQKKTGGMKKYVSENTKHVIKLTESQINKMNGAINDVDTHAFHKKGSNAPYTKNFEKHTKEIQSDNADKTNEEGKFIKKPLGAKGCNPTSKMSPYTIPISCKGKNCTVDEGTEKIFEIQLDDFGKHPSYGKSPIDGLTTSEDGKYKDWNDESTKGNAPYGRSKGKSDPYVEMLTDKIMRRFTESKKKNK